MLMMFFLEEKTKTKKKEQNRKRQIIFESFKERGTNRNKERGI